MIHLIAWGDSLTSGSDWMNQLPNLGLDWTWEDHGQPGEASWEGRARFAAWLETATPHTGEIVVLMWGTNDVRRSGWTAHDSLDALRSMANAAQLEGYPVVIAVPPPFVVGVHTDAEVLLYNTRLEAIDAGSTCLTEHVASAFLYWQTLPGFPSDAYYTLYDGTADGVHPGTVPTVTGYSGRVHLAEPIAEAILLPEPGTSALLCGVLLLAGLRRWGQHS